MNRLRTRQELAKKQGSLGGLVFALTLCLAATVGCQQGPDPLQKAFDAIGGQDLG